jgi:hypothetical protein
MSDAEWDSDAEKDYHTDDHLQEQQQEQEQEQEEDTREDNGVLIRYCYCNENPKSYVQTMTLPCSHVVHTQCFCNRLMEHRELPCDVLCLRCGTPTADPLDHHRILNDEQARTRVEHLWNTDEKFRADVYDVLSARKLYIRHSATYKPQRAAVIRRFKNAIKVSIAYIKDQVRASKAELRAIPAAMLFRRADGAFRRKFRALRTVYNVWNIEELNHVEGAPRIPSHISRHMYYRRNPFYVRI